MPNKNPFPPRQPHPLLRLFIVLISQWRLILMAFVFLSLIIFFWTLFFNQLLRRGSSPQDQPPLLQDLDLPTLNIELVSKNVPFVYEIPDSPSLGSVVLTVNTSTLEVYPESILYSLTGSLKSLKERLYHADLELQFFDSQKNLLKSSQKTVVAASEIGAFPAIDWNINYHQELQEQVAIYLDSISVKIISLAAAQGEAPPLTSMPTLNAPKTSVHLAYYLEKPHEYPLHWGIPIHLIFTNPRAQRLSDYPNALVWEMTLADPLETLQTLKFHQTLTPGLQTPHRALNPGERSLFSFSFFVSKVAQEDTRISKITVQALFSD